MTSTTALAIQAAVVLVVALGGALIRVRASRDVLDLAALVSAITGLLFALPAFGLLSSDDKLFQPGAHSALSRCLLVVLVALLAFHLAIWVWNRRTHPDSASEGGRWWVDLIDTGWVVWMLCGVAVACAVVIQVGADGIIGRTQNPLALRSTEQLPWWYFFAQGGLCMSQLAYWIALAGALRSGTRLLSWPVIATGVLALVLSASQGRMMIVNLLLPAVLLVHYHRRRLTVVMLIGALALGLAYFLVWDAYREEQASQRPSGLSLSPTGVWNGITNNLDYSDSFVRLVVDEAPMAYGATYLAPATKPIPRSVWPGKPLGGNSRLTEIILPGTLAAGFSRAASAVTEGYLNFGLVGPPVVYVLLGVICAALIRWRTVRPARPDATLLYAVGFVGVLTFVRTDAQIATTFLGYYLLPLLVIAVVLRSQKARRGQPRVRSRRRGSSESLEGALRQQPSDVGRAVDADSMHRA